MPISTTGSFSAASIVVPDIYINIESPSSAVITGAAYQRIGLVGTGAWGPVGVPTAIGSVSGATSAFGARNSANTFDINTAVAVLTQQGATDIRVVRVTDGSDTAAGISAFATGLKLTALYTGTGGNSITAALAQIGSTTRWRLTLTRGSRSEAYTIDTSNSSGAAFWAALASAVNNGQNNSGASQIAVASAVTGVTTSPAAATGTFSGGTDGSGVTESQVLGTNATDAATGMYALAGQGVQILVAAGYTSSTTWSTILSIAESLAAYAMVSGPSGESISAMVTLKNAAGVASPWIKVFHGDWLSWLDTVSGTTLTLPPHLFGAGMAGALLPSYSLLNQEMNGIIGSQRCGLTSASASGAYASAELEQLFEAGIDVITNPAPGGDYYAARAGLNSSTDDSINGDEYTRMTDYLAASFNSSLGVFVGRLIDTALANEIKAALNDFLSSCLSSGILVPTTSGANPWSITIDLEPQDSYVVVTLAVEYAGVNRKFVVNLNGGVTVSITTAT